MARPIKRLQADLAVVEELRRRSRASTSTVRERDRAGMILLRLDGVSVTEAAVRLKTTAKRVSMWSKRFEEQGLDGLEDEPGRGRKPSIPANKIERIVTEVTRPPKSRKRWSVRSMGRHAGVSHSTVQRVWSKNDLKPHVTRMFKLSNDAKFEEKFWDVIGLYLDPPAKALVLCCDEKSQCQALESLDADVIRTGSFASVGELVRDIEAYLDDRNANPKPYKWRAKGEAILEKIRRARAALDKTKAA
jgi:transposase